MSHRRQLLAYLGLAAAMIIGFATIHTARQSEPASPLGPYPLQHVRSRVAGVAGPAVRSGKTVVIVGTLCAKKRTPVLTDLAWRAPKSPGTFVTVAVDIRQVRLKGCVTYGGKSRPPFMNPMPAEVRVLAAQGIAEWVVQGNEVPAAQIGATPTEFTSEPFLVIPR